MTSPPDTAETRTPPTRGRGGDRRRREEARRTLGRITYPAELPISARAEEIVEAITNHQVVVIAGETGSGKSTQLPKLCLQAGRGVNGMIGHTQPRRIAARAVAERVAEELGTSVGELVGYQVRFTDRTARNTLVKLMTDGILLNELQHDRSLSAYDTIIIDEAHERGLNIDFILGYLKQLLPLRPDLHVIITSATIDTQRFADHFAGGDGRPAPIIEVSGRAYPVEMRYRPLDPEEDPAPQEPGNEKAGNDKAGNKKAGNDNAAKGGPAKKKAAEVLDVVDGIVDAVTELVTEGPGDILVFASGERDIRDAADALREARLRNTEILPLYSRLSAAEQHRVFSTHSGRRVVIATNIAETSLTVPGIRYVVDPGLARISRYNRKTKVQRLPIEPVSQASANQRSGRCGRLGPGIAIRLYSEGDFTDRPEFTEPEIMRTNLASVILQMTAIGLGDVAAFAFVDRPDTRQIADGVALLEELGAIISDPDEPGGRRLTPIGKRLARLPLDPRLGRMVLAAEEEGCVHEVMVIAAGLSIQDPRERPAEKRHTADQYHAEHIEPGSDFLTLLNLWDHLRDLQNNLTGNQFRKRCKQEFLHHLRVREWRDVYSQIRRVAKDLGIPNTQGPNNHDGIHRAMLTGLLSNIGVRADRAAGGGGAATKRRQARGQARTTREYLGTRSTQFTIGSGSVLTDEPPSWIVAAELVETNRLWTSMAAGISPRWVEGLAGDLADRTYDEAEWDAGRVSATTIERVAFRGLTIVAGRRINLGRVDPPLARTMFIEHALVAGDWEAPHGFLARNADRIQQVAALEDRVRRRGLLASEDVLIDFYDQRLPPDIVNGAAFDTWWRAVSADRPHLLDIDIDVLMATPAGATDMGSFPDQWTSGSPTPLELDYQFTPEDPDIDGVTIDIPLAILPAVDAATFDWQVPGLRRELIISMIRALPKALRRGLVPAPDTASAVLGRVGPDDGPFLPVLARELTRLGGQPIRPEHWAGASIPAHLRPRYRVMGDHGPLASGKDLSALKYGVDQHMQQAVRAAAPTPQHAGLTAWTIGDLPKEVRNRSGTVEVVAYPALVDEGATVGVRSFTTAQAQSQAMRAGTRRLLRLSVPNPLRAVAAQLTRDDKLALTLAPHADVPAVIEDCLACVIDAVVKDAGGPAWDAKSFRSLADGVTGASPRLVIATARAAARIVEQAGVVKHRLRTPMPPTADGAKRDIAQQLGRLVYPGFVAATGATRLPHLPRYVQALLVRLDSLGRNPTRDSDNMAVVRDLEEELRLLVDLRGGTLPADRVSALRWTLEELRVSLFAQNLGTAERVSESRVRNLLETLRVS